MKKLLLFILFQILLQFDANAQHHYDLMVYPRNLNFYNDFERSLTVSVTNNSDIPISIDSVQYNHSVYFIRFNSSSSFPASLNVNEQFSFEVIQFNYFNLQPNDSTSTISIFNSSNEPVIELQTHHYHMMYSEQREVFGNISDSISALNNAKVYFFYDQTTLLDSAFTDDNGNYSIQLPNGFYTACASREGYYTKFAHDKDTPFGADLLQITGSMPTQLDFILEKMPVTPFTISGFVVDVDEAPLEKTVVVLRKGTHTPTKIVSDSTADLNKAYTVITDASGYYTLDNLKYPGSYYVQAFAPFSIPGYYNHNQSPSAFWQNADSLDVQGAMNNINIVLERDSAYGAGNIGGSVFSNLNNEPITDVIVYARSIKNQKRYSYNLTDSDGNYSIPMLPYGDYELIAEKMGVETVISSILQISSIQDSINDVNIVFTLTSIKNEIENLDFNLKQNYPNPFNPATEIEFSMLENANAQLNIYNILGQKIATILNRYLTKGNYRITFNAGNLASGIYLYELKTSNRREIKKMNLIR